MPPLTLLRAMTEEEYAAWLATCVRAYADELAQVDGLSPEQSARRARAQIAELLPAGRDSPRTWLLRILDDSGSPVGVLWIGPHPHRVDAAWVYDVLVDPDERGRGFGRRALLAAEDLVREAGISALGLNVFGHNPGASRLYAGLGYAVVSQQMHKVL